MLEPVLTLPGVAPVAATLTLMLPKLRQLEGGPMLRVVEQPSAGNLRSRRAVQTEIPKSPIKERFDVDDGDAGRIMYRGDHSRPVEGVGH